MQTIPTLFCWIQPPVSSQRSLPLDVQQQRRCWVENAHVLAKNLVDHRDTIPAK